MQPAASPSPRPDPARIESLDALRGITVAAMLLVNNPGSWSHVHPPLSHATWDGCTLADLVFPFFLFTVGASMAFSFPRAVESGRTRAAVLARAMRRGLVLVLLGLMLNASSPVIAWLAGGAAPDWSTLRLPGVLQRIGLVFMLAAPIAIFASTRVAIAACFVIIAAYGAWLGTGSVDPATNPTAVLDRAVLSARHLYKGGPYDPEGLGSTPPAVASCLLGLVAARSLLRSDATPARTTALLAMAGICLMATGLAAAPFWPVNKPIWSVSYVVFTGGAAMAAWAALRAMMDLRGWRRPFHPAVVFGSNAIFAFVATGLVARVLGAPIITTPGGAIGVHAWMHERLFVPLASPINASLVHALATVLAWYAVHAWLMRRRIFFKV
jgi:predicted acyltransferase